MVLIKRTHCLQADNLFQGYSLDISTHLCPHTSCRRYDGKARIPTLSFLLIIWDTSARSLDLSELISSSGNRIKSSQRAWDLPVNVL